MKRLRDNMSPGGSHSKRPFGRGDSNGQPCCIGGGAGGTSQSLTTTDALTYLKEVKEMFQDQKDKYDMFLEIMKDFKAQRTDTAGVINRVKELFKGHNNLILGFNTFLPRGYEITLDDDEALQQPKKTVEFDEAITFVNKIKRRFLKNEHVYKSFLDILNMYRKEHTDIDEVYGQVASLFEEHPDLLQEFRRFLPDNSVAPPMHHGLYHRDSFQRYNERSSTGPTLRKILMNKHHGRDRITTSLTEHNLSVAHHELDDDSLINKERKMHTEKESKEKRNSETDGRQFQQRKPARKVEGFEVGSSYSSYGDRDAAKSMFNYGFSFFENVKEKLAVDEYQSFVNLFDMFIGKIIRRSELEKLATDLLKKYPDLLKEFNVFVERCPDIQGVIAGLMNRKSSYNDGGNFKTPKLEDKKELKRENEGAKDRYREKNSVKSIQELDLSAYPRCTPSYRFLPDDCLRPIASQRSSLGAEVLNDRWVSVTSGSEDYSFKHMRRNQYEESLFRCEDDRFELDMLMESVNSTAKRAEDLLNSINENGIKKDGPIRIEDYFTAFNLRCVEQIYGDHGLDVIDILRKNPTFALPVILTRLKQKQEDWTMCRSDFNKVWAEVYEQNHYKSLDHRSFYFKQQDSKNLSTKSLVAEIKELKEKMKNDDDLVMAIAARYMQPLASHLEYVYSDSDIHDDLYKIVEFSCEEVCSSKEQFNKIMKFWTMFLEPFLHVPSRAHGAHSADNIGSNHAAVACSATSIGKNGSKPHAIACDIASQQKESASMENEETCPEENTFHRSSPQNGDSVVNEGCAMNPSDSGTANDDHEHRNGDVLPTSEGQCNNASMLVSLDNGDLTEGTKVDSNLAMVSGAVEVEKEEGELSPIGDQNVESLAYQAEDIGKDAGERDEVDPDVENSENASETREDASGTESARDECSREEHREEDHIERNEDDGKAESEIEAEGVVEEDGGSLNLSERSLLSARPLAKHLPAFSNTGQKNKSLVFYGNDDFYVLFRLHQILYERILLAKKTIISADDMKSKDSNDANALNPYARFMGTLYNLLDGSVDSGKFEDECRALIGNQSYVLFTLDKLIFKLIKQLHTMSTDEEDNKLLQLFAYEESRKVGTVDPVYYENARVVLHENNIYRLECSYSPAHLSVQLMDNTIERPEVFSVSVHPSFATYLHNHFLSVVSLAREPPAVILSRNKRKKAGLDENSALSSALDDVQIINGLECKISCQSSKISYVLDTEDFFFRPKKKRKTLPVDKSSLLDMSRVQRFHKILSNFL